MTGMRQKRQIQQKLPLITESRGETPTIVERVEPDATESSTESPAGTKRLMEVIVEPKNQTEALKRVRRNKGGAGIDGMTVYELKDHMTKSWPDIRKQLLEGTYKPQPVKRAEIPKPNGGVRKLGIPTVVDRLVQQMLLQILQPRLDPEFSKHSYGFRPGRSAHQAIAQAQEYIREGHEWVVDMDLEKSFDQVNHDILMSLLAKRIEDKRVLKLVRAFLNAGVMVDGLVSPTEEGTPQGGPLSPMLSNIVLDVLDRELERRGHRFVRYADDCNIYVRSERAGQRVMKGVTRFIERKLKLRVNPRKSAVGQVSQRKFLGFSFSTGKRIKRRISPQAKKRFKAKVRELTPRKTGRSLDSVIRELSAYLRGWKSYYGFCETSSVLRNMDSWVRRRLRCILWKQWKTPKNRLRELRRRGIFRPALTKIAKSSKGPWRISATKALHTALSTKSFDTLGLPRLATK